MGTQDTIVHLLSAGWAGIQDGCIISCLIWEGGVSLPSNNDILNETLTKAGYGGAMHHDSLLSWLEKKEWIHVAIMATNRLAN